MDLETAQKQVSLRLGAIKKAARDLALAFKAEKKAIDWMLKEFTKLRQLQADGFIHRDFVAGQQASLAWLNKVGTEEQIRVDLPWARGTAALDKSELKPIKEVFEYNFSNVLAITPESDKVASEQTQAEWEAEQLAFVEKRKKSDMVKIALRRAVSEDNDPEDDATQSFIVSFLDIEHQVDVDEAFVKQVLTEMGYFDPNVTK